MRAEHRGLTSVLAAGMLLAACSEGVTPPAQDDLDVAATTVASSTINGLVGSASMASLTALGGRLPADLSEAGLSAAELERPAPGIAALALRLLSSLPGAGGPRAIQVMRPAILGRTYVYDASTHRYVPAPGRPGAPANGVRFILYASDPGSGEPLAGQEVGYADLTDHGAATGLAVSLRFQAVIGGRTFLDYALSLAPTLNGGGQLRVTGFLADEQNRLDFSFGAASQAIGVVRSARVTFDLALPARRFAATGTVEAVGNGSEERIRVNVSVAIGDGLIQFAGESTRDAVNAAMAVNGRAIATITGDPRHPTVRGHDGRELTLAEAAALGGLASVVYGAIEMFEHLLEPVAAILGLAGSLAPR